MTTGSDTAGTNMVRCTGTKPMDGALEGRACDGELETSVEDADALADALADTLTGRLKNDCVLDTLADALASTLSASAALGKAAGDKDAAEVRVRESDEDGEADAEPLLLGDCVALGDVLCRALADTEGDKSAESLADALPEGVTDGSGDALALGLKDTDDDTEALALSDSDGCGDMLCDALPDALNDRSALELKDALDEGKGEFDDDALPLRLGSSDVEEKGLEVEIGVKDISALCDTLIEIVSDAHALALRDAQLETVAEDDADTLAL